MVDGQNERPRKASVPINHCHPISADTWSVLFDNLAVQKIQ